MAIFDSGLNVHVYVNDDAINRQRTENWIEEYLEVRDSNLTFEDAYSQKRPFMKDGHRCIFTGPLHKWAVLNKGYMGSQNKLATEIRKTGAENDTEKIKNPNGTRSTRSFYKLKK